MNYSIGVCCKLQHPSRDQTNFLNVHAIFIFGQLGHPADYGSLKVITLCLLNLI